MSERLILDKCIYCDNWFINVEGDYQLCGDLNSECFEIIAKHLDTSTIPSDKFRKACEEIREWIEEI